MIRQAMKDMIMDVFFDEQYMTEYMVSRSKQVLNTMDFKVMVENALNGEAMDGMLLEKLTKLADTQEGWLLWFGRLRVYFMWSGRAYAQIDCWHVWGI